MTNFEKFKSELTPESLSELVWCPYCPCCAYCKPFQGDDGWSCKKTVEKWCGEEAEE